jgi:hypothetical protein
LPFFKQQKINNEEYNNIDELIRDVRQIWFNCRTYNGPEHDITKMGQALSDVFEKKIAEIKSKNWDLEGTARIKILVDPL